MKNILLYGLLIVVLFTGCKGASNSSMKVDTVYVKDVIIYKVKITYTNGDVDTVYVKLLRSDDLEPHIDANSSTPFFDLNPDNGQRDNVLFYVRRADILSKN